MLCNSFFQECILVAHLRESDLQHSEAFHGSTTYRVTRPTGCLKLQVILCKRATNYRALLRKMTIRHPVSLRQPVVIYQIARHSTLCDSFFQECILVAHLWKVTCDTVRHFMGLRHSNLRNSTAFHMWIAVAVTLACRNSSLP